MLIASFSTSKKQGKQRGIHEKGYRTGGMGTFWRGMWMGAWHRRGGSGLQGRQVHRKFLCGSLSVDWQHFNRGLIGIMDTGWRRGWGWGGGVREERTHSAESQVQDERICAREGIRPRRQRVGCKPTSYFISLCGAPCAASFCQAIWKNLWWLSIRFHLIGPLCTMSFTSQASQAMHLTPSDH